MAVSQVNDIYVVRQEIKKFEVKVEVNSKQVSIINYKGL